MMVCSLRHWWRGRPHVEALQPTPPRVASGPAFTGPSPFGQPGRWLSRSARLPRSRLACRLRSLARLAKSGVGTANRHLPRDNVPRRLHALSMRWVLMLFVILAAVMGGEARAVVVSGRAVVIEWDGRAETEEKWGCEEDRVKGMRRQEEMRRGSVLRDRRMEG
jgi:hypothetical protein